ncbi:hypothetical protein D3C75_259610 [compost metagenome]
MPQHISRLDATIQQQASKRVVQCKDGRLGILRLGKPSVIGLPAIDEVRQFQVQIRLKRCGAGVYIFPEGRKSFVQRSTHARILRALSREHQGNCG